MPIGYFHAVPTSGAGSCRGARRFWLGVVAQGYAGWLGTGSGSLVMPEARGQAVLSRTLRASALGNDTL